jgi:hypothetical protein
MEETPSVSSASSPVRNNSRDDLSVTSETPFLCMSPESMDSTAWRTSSRRGVPRVYSFDPSFLYCTHSVIERKTSAPMLHIRGSREATPILIKKVRKKMA